MNLGHSINRGKGQKRERMGHTERLVEAPEQLEHPNQPDRLRIPTSSLPDLPLSFEPLHAVQRFGSTAKAARGA